MTSIDELIARLEKATGPDRELDFWISARVFDPSDYSNEELQADIDLVGIDGMFIEAAFTRSIDAAVLLAEKVLPGRGRFIAKGRTNPSEPMFGCVILDSDLGPDESVAIGEAEHECEPIAICLAVLKAFKEAP